MTPTEGTPTVTDLPVQLDLPGIALTPTGATTTGLATPETITAALTRCGRIGTAWRWIVGDLVLSLADGDLAQIPWTEVAALDIDTRASLARSVAVAYMIDPEIRRPGLSWGHHEAVAALGREDQDRWLQVALDDGLTIGAMSKLIAAEHHDGDLDDEEPPALLPRLRRTVIAQVEDLWAVDPDAVVVIRSDGTWRVQADAGVGG